MFPIVRTLFQAGLNGPPKDRHFESLAIVIHTHMRPKNRSFPGFFVGRIADKQGVIYFTQLGYLLLDSDVFSCVREVV